MATERKRYVNNSGANTAGGNGTEDIVSGANRAYLSAAECESAEDTNIVTADVYILVDWRTGTGGDADADTASLAFNGTTDGPDNYVHYRGAPTGDGGAHPGQWSDNHARLSVVDVFGVSFADEYVRLENLQFEASESTSTNRSILATGTVDAGGSDMRIRGCIIRQAPGSAGTGGIWGARSNDADATMILVNNLFLGFRQGAGKGAICDIGTMTFYNNGFIDCDIGLEESGGTTVGRNNYAQDCTDGFAGTITGEYNCSDIASDAPGTNPVTGDIAFVGPPNYQLASGDTVAKGAGIDLSADGTYPFSTDMLGATRTDWSIGPMEAAGGGGDQTLVGVNMRTEERVRAGVLASLVTLLGDRSATYEQTRASVLASLVTLGGSYALAEEAVRAGSLSPGAISLGGVHLNPEDRIFGSTLTALISLLGTRSSTEEQLRAGTLATVISLLGARSGSEELARAGFVVSGLSVVGSHATTEEAVRAGALSTLATVLGSQVSTEERVRSGVAQSLVTLLGVKVPTSEQLFTASITDILTMAGTHVPSGERFQLSAVSVGPVTLVGINVLTEEQARTGLIDFATLINGALIRTEERVHQATVAPGAVTLQGIRVLTSEGVRAGAIFGQLSLSGSHVNTDEQTLSGAVSVTAALFGSQLRSEESARGGSLSTTRTVVGATLNTEERVRPATLLLEHRVIGGHVDQTSVVRAAVLVQGEPLVGGSHLASEERLSPGSIILALNIMRAVLRQRGFATTKLRQRSRATTTLRQRSKAVTV